MTRDTGVDISGVRSSAGDLNSEQLGKAISESDLLQGLPDVVNESLNERKHILIFLPNVSSAIKATDIFNDAGITAGCVLGITPSKERKQTLRRFAKGKIRVLVNCMVLTEGFDCPQIDALIVARPTKSSLLIQQMVGRGLRKAPGKKDCLILDLAFKRRQEDLVSVAASGIFGGFRDLQFSRQDLSLLELIEHQKERAPLLQGLHNVLTQRIIKLDTENPVVEDEIEESIDDERIDEIVPTNEVSEGILLLVEYCFTSTGVWERPKTLSMCGIA